MKDEATTSDNMFTDRISELVSLLRKANEIYRTGPEFYSEDHEARMSDAEYDTLMEELETLDPDNELLNQVGYIAPDDTRKQPLPVPMASMNKIKTIDDYHKWLKSKNIPGSTRMILTPKFDGLSFCVNETTGDAWSRGDGVLGQYSPEHYKLINNRRNRLKNDTFNFHAIGEVIMSRASFEKNKQREDGTEFRNPRNLVAGKINDKKPNELLKHCEYIRYGLFSDDVAYQQDKEVQLSVLNELNPIPVLYLAVLAEHITEEMLYGLFKEWNKDYEIDGIIIEVDNYELREKLGRETSSGNPCFARAFKGAFEQTAQVPILDMNYQVTKQGFLAPVCVVQPATLDGATVSNVFADNAKFVKDMGIGIGAVVEIKRSGMVIPRIIRVIKTADNINLPTQCPSCSSALSWNETKVQLCCTNDDCQAQQLQKIIAFFEILGVENMGEGVCEQLYDAGYNSVAKIIDMTQDAMKALDRFGERKAEIVYNTIRKATMDIPLSKLQHASGCFKNLGSKKLELLVDLDENATVSQITSREGFSEVLAKNYLEGIKKFNEFRKGLNVTVKAAIDKPVVISDLCKGWNVVFTGFTSDALEKHIVENGGVMNSGVSKKTTHLVMKQKGSGSSKEQKAEQLGVQIYNLDEFTKLLYQINGL